MIAEELVILDPDSASWQRVRPLLTIVLTIEQNDAVWNGWSKQHITRFLADLPAHCTLVVSVWATDNTQELERVHIGFVCEVRQGQICTIRTLEALVGEDVPPIQELEPGAEHALAIMRRVRSGIAPVAWALFTDKATWEEWLYTDENSEHTTVSDKSALLTLFARQGRCVLLGSQVRHHK